MVRPLRPEHGGVDGDGSQQIVRGLLRGLGIVLDFALGHRAKRAELQRAIVHDPLARVDLHFERHVLCDGQAGQCERCGSSGGEKSQHERLPHWFRLRVSVP